MGTIPFPFSIPGMPPGMSQPRVPWRDDIPKPGFQKPEIPAAYVPSTLTTGVPSNPHKEARARDMNSTNKA